ncbi:hypothetical protein AA13595_0881 [Gluconacetobacter johannae DSM 13595]|nr:hypothetical protein AA13595_0881 [Gluconacetobacter johannae DSM 13595]
MASRAYSTSPQTWAWTLVRATGISVAMAFLFFVALAGFAQPETLASHTARPAHAPLVLAEGGR